MVDPLSAHPLLQSLVTGQHDLKPPANAKPIDRRDYGYSSPLFSSSSSIPNRGGRKSLPSPFDSSTSLPQTLGLPPHRGPPLPCDETTLMLLLPPSPQGLRNLSKHHFIHRVIGLWSIQRNLRIGPFSQNNRLVTMVCSSSFYDFIYSLKRGLPLIKHALFHQLNELVVRNTKNLVLTYSLYSPSIGGLARS